MSVFKWTCVHSYCLLTFPIIVCAYLFRSWRKANFALAPHSLLFVRFSSSFYVNSVVTQHT